MRKLHVTPIRIGVIADCDQEDRLRRVRADAGRGGAALRRSWRKAQRAKSVRRHTGSLDLGEAGRPPDCLRLDGFLAEHARAAPSLVEQQKANAVVLPFEVNAGLVVKDYARRHPEVIFIPISTEQTPTLKQPLANVFRFQPDGAQLVAGSG